MSHSHRVPTKVFNNRTATTLRAPSFRLFSGERVGKQQTQISLFATHPSTRPCILVPLKRAGKLPSENSWDERPRIS